MRRSGTWRGVGDGVLYGVWLIEPVLRFDNLQHAVGFGVVGRAGWELLRRRLPVSDPVVAWCVIVARRQPHRRRRCRRGSRHRLADA